MDWNDPHVPFLSTDEWVELRRLVFDVDAAA